MNERTVRRNLIQGLQEPGQLGGHHAIDADGEVALAKMLLEAFDAGQVRTKKQLLQVVREGHNPKRTEGWINAFIGGHLDAPQTYRSLH
jgi:hypothetical protein